ncbi:hypothetical protein [Haliangium sp.]|uniref:hypothetical protein n=1 Tax=Haliangium sp. TaxID=2663208 RepID=UPI003D10D681
MSLYPQNTRNEATPGRLDALCQAAQVIAHDAEHDLAGPSSTSFVCPGSRRDVLPRASPAPTT